MADSDTYPRLACPGGKASSSFNPMKSSEYLHGLFGLEGKVAVVIGGTGELCGAMAEGLAAAGAEVVLVGRNEEKAAPRLARIHAAGGRGYFVATEASDKPQLQQLLETV